MAKNCNLLIIFGASGDLAKKELYPALWNLFRNDQLEENTRIIGFGRSNLNVDNIRENCEPFVDLKNEEGEKYDEFWQMNHYCRGSYSDPADAIHLSELCLELESDCERSNRTFYLALPPFLYESVTALISEKWMAPKGRTKVAIEKPFGRDLESFYRLDKHLRNLFSDEQIVLVDHYLALKMVKIIAKLQSSAYMASYLNKEKVSAVMISLKEDFGTEGRGGYFDGAGIVRDVMQNHLLQILALVAMDKPKSYNNVDVQKAKNELIQRILPVKREDIVLGQYEGNPNGETEEQKLGYLDDETVPKNSKTATFATIVFHVDNERWEGVPFIMRCGKALNELRDEVRIQFKPSESDIHQLVFQVKPYLKSSARGIGPKEEEIADAIANPIMETTTNGPYEDIFLSILKDIDRANFVGREELESSWKLFTPILEETKTMNPEKYLFGSSGPKLADELCEKHNFILSQKI